MSRTNPVTRILITKGNQAPLTAGQAPGLLAPGQIGVFSYDTNLSLDSSSTGVRNFYLAVGVDHDGDSATDDISKSAGTHIQKKNVTNQSLRCYTPSLPKIVDITGFAVKCETDYGINIGVKNGEAFANYGFNTPIKTFMVRSLCCTDDCQACPESNCNDVALKMVNNVNADLDGFIKADLLDYTTTPGTGIVVALTGYAAWVADTDNAGKCLGVRLTTVPEKLQSYFGGVNRKYDFVRGTNIDVSLVEGFNCNGVVTTTQELVYEQGSGYDLAQEEYMNAGYAGFGNYRQSELTGLIAPYDQFAVTTGKYLTYALTYDQESVGGWQEYKNNLLTIVGIPCGETTTIAALFPILDAIMTQFEPLTNDSAACPSCTTVNYTSARATTADGILDSQGD